MSGHRLEQRTLELLHAELDGTLTEPERRDLRERLAASAEAREYRDGLRRMDAGLRSLPGALPPPGLHQRILNSVELAAPHQSPGRSMRVTSLVPYGLAAGLGALVVLGLVGTGGDVKLDGADVDHLVGTLAPVPPHGGTVMDTFRVQHPEIRSIATLEERLGAPWMEVSVESEDEATVAVTFDPDVWQFQAVGNWSGAEEDLQITEGVIRSRGVGRRHFVVSLRSVGNPAQAMPGGEWIGIEISVNGQPVERGALAFGAGPDRHDNTGVER